MLGSRVSQHKWRQLCESVVRGGSSKRLPPSAFRISHFGPFKSTMAGTRCVYTQLACYLQTMAQHCSCFFTIMTLTVEATVQCLLANDRLDAFYPAVVNISCGVVVAQGLTTLRIVGGRLAGRGVITCMTPLHCCQVGLSASDVVVALTALLDGGEADKRSVRDRFWCCLST